jgi:EipB-like
MPESQKPGRGKREKRVLVSPLKDRQISAASLLAVAAIVGFFSLPILAGKTQPRLPKLTTRELNVDAIQLASHRAVYDLTLYSSTGSKSPTFARGRIAFDFSGSQCEGYTQTFRQLTELQPAEGPTRVSDMRSTTFEDANGKAFAFKTETQVDDEPADSIDGRAQRTPGMISVILTKPKDEKFDIEHAVLFPTEHLKYILAAAEAGEHVLEEKVYDGSDTGDKVFQTTTFIGAPVTKAPIEQAVQIPLLKDMRRWPVTISYFDIDHKDELPNYVLSFDLYENGISRALRLDYGDFVLAGEMTSLELRPTAACTK